MNKRRLPKSIIFHIIEAKKIGGDWCKSKSGRIALAFLLCYFDDDGHYYGGLCGSVFSASKAFLEHLKREYCIDNEIRMKLHKSLLDDAQIVYVKELKGEGIRPSYHLTLGTELYRKMIKSYNNSLERKKPLPETGKDVLTIRFNY